MRPMPLAVVLAFSIAAGWTGQALAEAAPPPPANKRNCQNITPFPAWFRDFKAEAIADGVNPATLEGAIGGMTPDQSVISRDRKQGFFTQTFLEFYGKLATNNRYQTGRSYVQRHKAIFDRAEDEFGAPGAVITGFWALESDFGIGMGNLPVLRSLLTLAWDCRRGDLFREELKAAMMIIDKGYLRADEMIGSWAGELGQTQFLPRHYLNHAVDYDNDGRRDLMQDIPDIIGSTANFINHLGWKRGEPWLQEVRLTQEIAWDQADLAIEHPGSQWEQWGLQSVDGKPIRKELNASLLLPMGKNGPAFLAYQNFRVYLQWNQSLTYATTAAHLAARIAGAPAMSRGNGAIESLNYEQIKELQTLLTKRGFDVGEVDGKLGAGTRKAVKTVQQKYGFDADSYPTPELLAALRERS